MTPKIKRADPRDEPDARSADGWDGRGASTAFAQSSTPSASTNAQPSGSDEEGDASGLDSSSRPPCPE